MRESSLQHKCKKNNHLTGHACQHGCSLDSAPEDIAVPDSSLPVVLLLKFAPSTSHCCIIQNQSISLASHYSVSSLLLRLVSQTISHLSDNPLCESESSATSNAEFRLDRQHRVELHASPREKFVNESTMLCLVNVYIA